MVPAGNQEGTSNMGYTHYWHRRDSIRQPLWDEAIGDVRRIFAASEVPIAHEHDEPALLPTADEQDIQFNGVLDDGHETFWFPREVKDAGAKGPDGRSFEFCKTERKPYDFIVRTVLCVLLDRFGDQLEVTSDGSEAETWAVPSEWASKVLGRVIRNPFAAPAQPEATKGKSKEKAK